MSLRRALTDFWALLWPDYDKVDEEFRSELCERGVVGLRIVSTLAIVLPVLVILVFWPLGVADHPRGGRMPGTGLAEGAAGLAIGIAGWLLSRTGWGRRRSRGLAVAVGWLLGLVATADMINSGGHTSSIYTALVLAVLLAVAVFPLRPLSMLGYGLIFVGMFATSAVFDPTAGWPPPLSWLERFFLLVTVAVLGAVLTAVMARLHIKEHESRDVLAESLAALQRTQANLIASKRAASQGRLAAAISHEINNPLSVLQSSSGLIERHLEDLACKCGDPEAVERSVADAKRAAQRSRQALRRITELVDRLERFTQLDTAERRPLDVNALLDDAVGVLSGSWGEGVRVVRDYGDVPEVLAHPAGLSEVFGNVLSNAASAVEGDGEIRVTTRYGRGYVWVQIADTGRGIDMEDMSALFDPSFRVRSGRIRTGWGLFISRQIVHDHHGEFHITSELDRGTEVEICLPVGPG
jgi:signal transduction histidine kinase